MNFIERAEYTQNPAAKKLFKLMAEKETTLAVNPDVNSTKELLRLADLVGPHICVLKTHVDLLEDFNFDFVSALQELSEKHQFLIFEDRKFGDIGAVARGQYEKGMYKIASWAHITNAHPVPGPGVIEGLKEVGGPLGRGLLLVAEMSSKGSLATGAYTEESVEMAKLHPDFVMGFVAQRKIIDDPRFIHFTPGVKLAEGSDNLGQQYNTPEKVIKERGSDVIIVGRGIVQSKDPKSEAARYREAALLSEKVR